MRNLLLMICLLSGSNTFAGMVPASLEPAAKLRAAVYDFRYKHSEAVDYLEMINDLYNLDYTARQIYNTIKPSSSDNDLSEANRKTAVDLSNNFQDILNRAEKPIVDEKALQKFREQVANLTEANQKLHESLEKNASAFILTDDLTGQTIKYCPYSKDDLQICADLNLIAAQYKGNFTYCFLSIVDEDEPKNSVFYSAWGYTPLQALKEFFIQAKKEKSALLNHHFSCLF